MTVRFLSASGSASLHFRGMERMMRYKWHLKAFDEAAAWGRQILSYNPLREDIQANYTYDGAGNMSTVSNSANVHYASFSGYNAFGQVGQISYNNGVNTIQTYDQYNSRLHEMTTTTPGSGEVQDFVYGYDNNGNIRTITDNVTPANSQTFSYDWLNRLATARGPYGSVNYNTDPAGNVQNPPNTANGTYSNDQALVYDYDNRVTSIGSTSFVYDYQGARVQKNDGANNITTYVNRLYEINTTNGVTKHIFAGGRRIASINGGNISYYHPDHLGSLSIATNAGGSKVQQVTYLPYGEVNTNSYSGTDLPYKFTGHELDPETGLYYCGARYYDAAMGRFITPDTIVQSPGDPQSLNRYAYARNNPLLFTDPSGHIFGIDDLIIGIIIGAAIGATMSAITGGNILMGALTGGITGGALGAGAWICGAAQLTGVVAAGVYAGAGASAGAINAGISGSNVGIGAAFGAGFAVASYACPYPSFSPFGQGEFGSVANRMFNSSLTGAAFGAVSAGMTGGDILKGMGMGAASWGIAEAGTMAMANAAGYILSGGQAPKFQNGTFIYDLGPNSGGLITFSNVILGNASMINEKMISYTSAGYSEEDAPTYLQHENGHSLQGTILGPDYIPLQAASLTVGALVGTFYGYPIDYGSHAFGLLEHYWQTVPEPPR